MKQLKTISIEKTGMVAIVTFNKPDKLNTFNYQMNADLLEAFDILEEDDGVRVLIVTGVGKAFSAGADIREMPVEQAEIRRWGKKWFQRIFPRIVNFPKAIIGAINGIAYGEAFQLVFMFDLNIASEKATFSFSATQLGMACVYGIVRAGGEIGRARAKELLFTGKSIDAQEAYRMGIVNKVVQHEKLMDEAMEWAKLIAEMPPLSIETIKMGVNMGLGGYEFGHQALMALMSTDDWREGRAAFLEKMRPHFKGS